MSKRGYAVLLAVLLCIGLFRPAALAAEPPPNPDSGIAGEQMPVEPGAGQEQPAQEEDEPLGDAQEGPAPEPPLETPPAEEVPGPSQEEPEPPLETAPAYPEQEDGCSTPEELAALVALDEGGTVTVTGDLTLSEGDDLYLTAETPVTIDLGDYGVTIPQGASLTLEGPIFLTGRGSPSPLLRVEGSLTTRRGVELEAMGDGAVAVELRRTWNSGWAGDWTMEETAVTAEGPQARAVHATGGDTLELYRMELRAGGAQAAAVRSDVPVRLLFSTVDGAVEAPELTLDASLADPTQADAKVIRRVAGPGDTLSENGLCLPVDASAEELDRVLEDRLGDHIGYALYDRAGEADAESYSAPGDWSGEAVDLTRPGTYWFTGVPEEPRLGKAALPERRVPVHVVDPDTPWLMDAERFEESVYLRYFRAVEGAGDWTLRYSMDGGESWRDAAALPGAELTAGRARIGALPQMNVTYLFQLEVRDGDMAGRSNVLAFPYYDGRHWNGGGDWDGGDRGDQGELPPAGEVIPPPAIEPEGPPVPEDTAEEDSERPGQVGAPSPAPDPEPAPTPTPKPEPPPVIVWVETKPEREEPADAFPVEPTPSQKPEPTQPPEQTPPAPGAPPTPTPRPTPAPTPAPRLPELPELPEEATLSLTAAELRDQLQANPAGVTLIGGGFKVFLPAALLEQTAAHFSARLDRPAPGQFEIRLWADGREIAGFEHGAFTAAVPVESPETAHIICTAPDGTELTASSVKEGRAEFSLTATGLYTLSATPPEPIPSEIPEPIPAAEPASPAPEQKEPQAPVLPLALCCALVLAGGVVFLLIRRGGR